MGTGASKDNCFYNRLLAFLIAISLTWSLSPAQEPTEGADPDPRPVSTSSGSVDKSINPRGPDSAHAVDSSFSILEGPANRYVAFGEGERLVFSIQYGIINAGEATLEVRNIAILDSTPCYHIVSDARSNEAFSIFFKVRDRYESFMDTTELVSLRYEKHLREGKFKKDETVYFDQKNHTALYKDETVPIPARAQDVLSSLYYIRTLPLKVGNSIAVANHTDGKNYPLLVKVLREEEITVEAGTFNCIVVEPLLKTTGVFRQKGRLTVWLTNDKYKIPVLMKSKVVIGSVAAVLKSYQLAREAD